jgi:ribonuclease Z
MPCLSYNVDFRRLRKFDAERAKALNVPVMYWKRLQKGEQITLGDRAINPEMVLSEPRKGIKISYCTDSRPTEGLVQLIQESDLFICEGMYGDESDYHKAEQNKHMMFSEAGVLAKQGNVKELWLTHYSPSLIKPEDYIESAKVVFINTIAGRDLLTKSIKYSEHQ